MWDLIVSVPDHYLSFYFCEKTLVRPIMENASVVWDPFIDDNIREL